MIELAPHDLCTGCTSCANTCPHHAITMREDDEGFLYPAIDEDACVECGLCTKRCPVLFPAARCNTKTPKTFALWSYPDRTSSSSGGAFSAFARQILDNEGIVCGAAFDEKLWCHHIKVDDLKGLSSLRGSKYVQSELDDIFLKVKDCLTSGKRVLFSGTPCQIAGLYSYLQKDYDNLLTLDLVCHGTPSNAVFQAYLSKLQFLKKIKISSFEFRRLDGWGFAPAVEYRSKLTPVYGVENLYMNAFDRSALFRPSCYSCPYAKFPRVGDCSIADFWGIGRHGKPFRHNILKGVSLVLVNNEKGEDALFRLKNVFMEERTLEEALAENHNITHTSVAYPQRDAVIRAFLNPDESLEAIAAAFDVMDRSLKGKIKEWTSKCHVFDLVKSVYNKYKAL